MSAKHYALQVRYHDWERWELVPGQYATIQEAGAARSAKPIPKLYRIVASYTVTRYKPVKEVPV